MTAAGGGAAELTFGPWRLGALLGLGGFSEVRRARGVEPPWAGAAQALALKRALPFLLPAAAGAFEAETAALSRVQSAHVPRLLAAGEVAGVPYVVLPEIDGASLRGLLTTGVLAPAEAATLVADLAGALASCHAAGVLHGDLAPGNVLVDTSGRAWLTDFGLATCPERPDRPARTGTPAFLDPAAAADLPRSAANDLQQLGLLWARTLTGRSPLGPGPDWHARAAAWALDASGVTAALTGAGPHGPWLQRCLAADPPAGLASSLAAAVGAARDGAGRAQLARRVAASPKTLPSALPSAAEDRGERVTDPSGETVTLSGDLHGLEPLEGSRR